MANAKIPGPLGAYPIRIDSGTLSRTKMPQPGVIGLMDQASHAKVDHAKRALAIDIGQLILDITGIFDPSPISDGTNLLISLARGNWVDAVVSAVSIAPYIGDLSKTAKLPRYIKSVREAIRIAKFDFKWADALRTLFLKLTKVLDECIKLAADVLPNSAKTQLKELKYEVDKFLDPIGGTTNKLADSGKKADLRPSSNSTKSRRNIDRAKPPEKLDKKPGKGYGSDKNNGPKTTTAAVAAAGATAAVTGSSEKKPEAKPIASPVMPISKTLADKKKTLAERQSLIKKGREQAKNLTGENQQKLNAAADRLELNNRAVERARLAQDVYNAPGEQPPPIGWKRLSNDPKDLPPGLQDADWEHPKSGFRAALYESEIDGSKVLAFRGTANKAGWVNNGQQGLGFESEQYDRAMKLAFKMEKVYPNGFEISGHSLGGGLTAAGSIVTDSSGYSFNGSGLHPNTIKPYGKTRADGAQSIHAYHVKGEVLTSGQAKALNAVYTPVGTGVRYARQANPISIHKAIKGEKPLNLQPVVVYDAVGQSHELPAVDESGEPVSIIKANPVDRHGMEYVINGIEKQKMDDKNAITKAV